MKTEDFRLTAYALGQLHGPERDAFEKELAASEDLQKELAEIIALSQALTDLPPGEDTLTDDQRISLRDECLKNTRIARRQLITRRVAIGSIAALAACLVVAVILSDSGTKYVTVVNGSKAKVAVIEEFKTDQEFTPPAAPSPTQALLASSTDRQLAMPNTSIVPDESGREQLQRVDQLKRANEYLRNSADLERQLQGRIAQLQTASAPIAQNLDSSSKTRLVSAEPADTIRRTEVNKQNPQPYADDSALHAAVKVNAPAASAGESRVVAATAPAEYQVYRQAGDARVVGGSFAGGTTDQSNWASRQLAGWDGYSTTPGVSGNESYELPPENTFVSALEVPLSTFSIDVDTASYSNIRRMLLADQRPPVDAVRVEEMINYFTYDYPQPKGDSPFSVNVEVSRAPWAPQHELVRIGLKGREIAAEDRGPANLVFLIDVSGSMNSNDKLPLLKRSLDAMVKNLQPDDRVAIVVYAGASGLVLPSTPGKDRQRILEALGSLQSGGGTNGAAGIQLAYNVARENFAKGGNNRVILCTDGDFNVGVTNQNDLVAMIERERASGVFLSVLGFGTGNLKDSTMEKLADKGNGNYAYIDSFSEGRKVLVDQMNSTIFTIAKDVKIQIEFNPAKVAGYRLIGYENRLLAKEDFNNDKKDAGEIGAGHTVTALYEIVPAGQPLPGPSVDPLKYQTAPMAPITATAPPSSDLLTVKLRYKAPDGDKSQLLSLPIPADSEVAFDKASSDFQFATAVAAFGLKLRGSDTVADFSWNNIQSIARKNLGDDSGSYRAEFLTLLEKASRLSGENSSH